MRSSHCEQCIKNIYLLLLIQMCIQLHEIDKLFNNINYFDCDILTSPFLCVGFRVCFVYMYFLPSFSGATNTYIVAFG